MLIQIFSINTAIAFFYASIVLTTVFQHIVDISNGVSSRGGAGVISSR